MYVLDQVNDRVTRRGPDGRVEATIPIQLGGAQDVAVADDGSLVVLDRLGDKKLVIYDEAGRPRGELPLGGDAGSGDPGLLTGVFVDGKDVWVEREHGTLVRVGDTSGAPAEPKEAPGRPSRDGALWLSAGIVDAAAGRAFVSAIDRASGDHRFTRELRQKAELRAIVLLDSDRAGTIYFGVEVHVPPEREVVVVTCLEPLHGQPVGSIVLPANTLPEETFRDLAVLDAGGVVYALRSEAGVTYEVHECQ
jgi:outer membrane protein assembly factor BamB